MTSTLAETKTLVPTVACQENAPDELLPAYPAVPSTMDSAVTLESYKAAAQAHITDLNVWGVQAVGAFRREKIKRNATVKCLSDLRTSGLIN